MYFNFCKSSHDHVKSSWSRLQLTLRSAVLGTSAMDHRRTQICSKRKSDCTIYNHFTCNYRSNCLTGVCYVQRWWSHKILSSPTTAGLPAKFNSAQLRRQVGGQMPGTDYVLGINYHICCSVVPGRASGMLRFNLLVNFHWFSRAISVLECKPLDK